ncbi:BnaA09g08380D [Brassica napus]|uniref:S-acyltransferase n=1 Tax=Brassica napus TaxID=3708 RepID=A0A078HH57_BRANA|nr:BnaA09g08380D [Brassica napus]
MYLLTCLFLFVHAGTKEELILEDNTGATPLKLASDKGHRQLTLFLSKAMQTRSSSFVNKLFCGKLGETSYAPLLFGLIVSEMVLFFTSIVAASNLPKITAMAGLWAWFGLSCGVCSLIAFRRCSSKDPGYVKRSNEVDSDHTAIDPLIDINFNSPSWKGNWSQLCPTCKVIRPVRSKHCPTCKRCVEQFDHHCPWISNCVGKKNKRDFLVFVIMGGLTSFVGGSTAVQRIWRSNPHIHPSDSLIQHVLIEHPGAAVFLFFDLLIFIATMTLTISQAYMIARNITTNELWNTRRFSYLRGPDGRFYNPYNHGWQRNCSDFLVNGYTRDDEVVPSSIL